MSRQPSVPVDPSLPLRELERKAPGVIYALVQLNALNGTPRARNSRRTSLRHVLEGMSMTIGGLTPTSGRRGSVSRSFTAATDAIGTTTTAVSLMVKAMPGSSIESVDTAIRAASKLVARCDEQTLKDITGRELPMTPQGRSGLEL